MILCEYCGEQTTSQKDNGICASCAIGAMFNVGVQCASERWTGRGCEHLRCDMEEGHAGRHRSLGLPASGPGTYTNHAWTDQHAITKSWEYVDLLYPVDPHQYGLHPGPHLRMKARPKPRSAASKAVFG